MARWRGVAWIQVQDLTSGAPFLTGTQKPHTTPWHTHTRCAQCRGKATLSLFWWDISVLQCPPGMTPIPTILPCHVLYARGVGCWAVLQLSSLPGTPTGLVTEDLSWAFLYLCVMFTRRSVPAKRLSPTPAAFPFQCKNSICCYAQG